ncbi:hypothetical protein PG988_007572 [Apiospora saccharicola]
MDAIGKIQASIASASQETTVALANANFDLSLFRIEAPPEYKLLGSALAKSKRNIAEDGPAHVTARRLGSLFQNILPETPNLIRAYGVRASQIAQSSVVNPKGTDGHGPFKDYVGVDGTSIWAAATSGSAAIAAHLLACIIATYWAADEATAIWMELVAERKHRIQTKAATAEFFDLSETLSSRLELDQAQLASWDASARSWIRAANDSPVVSDRQKAVRSILDHMNMTVRNQQDLYTSVIEAWKLSLDTMEKIVTGSSYSIEDGSVVVALFAWHLYPDLIVLGSQAEEIFQKDELVAPGGCVTIGLTSHSLSLDRNSGVHWSLSLAHLRYYGALRTTSRSLKNTPSGNERFTREEFALIYIGVLIARWQAESPVSVDDAMSFMRLFISKLVELFEADHPEQLGSWTKACIAALDEYETTDSQARSLAVKFVNIGLRNQSLLNQSIAHRRAKLPPNLPGLQRHRSGFSLLGLNSLCFVKALENKDDQQRFLLATMNRLTHRMAEGRSPLHKMLILMERQLGDNHKPLFISTRSELKGLSKNLSSPCSICRSEKGEHYIARVNDCLSFPPTGGVYLSSRPPKPLQRYLKRHYTHSEANDWTSFKLCILVESYHFTLLEPWHEDRHPNDFDSTPVQRREEIEEYLHDSKLARYELLQLVGGQFVSRALRLLSTVCDVYENLPSSTISPNILDCTLVPVAHQVHWCPNRMPPWPPLQPMLDSKSVANLLRDGPLSRTLGTQAAFKILATFDAGVDLNKWYNSFVFSWNSLVAISTDDSLYVDPRSLGNVTTDRSSTLELRRVRGNVGRPGMSLIGGFETQTEWRQPRMDMWDVINHNKFHGKLEDTFSGTSLHLKFTGWTQAIDFGGKKCVPDGAYMEAVVSSHDSGTWLGDLSLPLLYNNNLNIIRKEPDCTGDTPVIGTMPPEDLVTVENWEELLTPHHNQPAVVMCHGNWQARMTALSLSRRKGYRTLLFDRHGCWQCAFRHLKRLKLREAGYQESSQENETGNSDNSDSDNSESSSNASEVDEGEKEKTSAEMSRSHSTSTLQQTASGDRQTQEESRTLLKTGDDDATLNGEDDEKSNPGDGIGASSLSKSIIPRLDSNASEDEDDSDSDDDWDHESDEESEEDVERLEEILETLPYIPTVFIL